MGAAGETATPPATKAAKTSPAPATPATTTAAAAAAAPAQDAQAAGAPNYHEWMAAFQAYYAAGGQPAAGTFSHPYMWGGQPMMPPYGAPHPSYGAMYPPGGVYPHPMYGQYGPLPTDAMMPAEQTETKPDAKPAESGKGHTPLKRSKGSKGSLTLSGKDSETGGKGNGVSGALHSSNGDENENETGTDGSTDGSDDGQGQNHTRKRSFEQMALEAVGAGGYMPPPGAVPGTPAVGTPGPGGSLDMSLDYWSGGSLPARKPGKQTSGSPSTSAPAPELWLQDEREVKRQRRKQSNRESARRSRLRKQAECEELGTRVDTLTVENMALRTELTRVTEECKRLQVENSTILQQVRSNSQAEVTAPMTSAPPASVQQEAADKEVPEAQLSGSGILKSKDEKSTGKFSNVTNHIPSFSLCTWSESKHAGV